MTALSQGSCDAETSSSTVDQADVDPRRARSRARLIDAAGNLLASGGVQAVTVDAVTRASKVGRATLYRHFGGTHRLLAATLERLLPHVEVPDASLPLRERLIELLVRQAILFDETPVHVTTLAWLALGSPQLSTDASDGAACSLRDTVGEQYREPFDRLLECDEARTQLGNIDTGFAICQLVGPIVFARLTGLQQIGRSECEKLIDTLFARTGK